MPFTQVLYKSPLFLSPSCFRYNEVMVIAGGDLANILNSILRPNDVIIITGAINYIYDLSPNYRERVAVLNFDREQGSIQMFRFPDMVRKKRHEESFFINLLFNYNLSLSLIFRRHAPT